MKTVADVAARRRAEALARYHQALAVHADAEELVTLGEAAGLTIAQIEIDAQLAAEAHELTGQIARAPEVVRRAAAAEGKLCEARQALEAETKRLQAEVDAAENAASEPRAALRGLWTAEGRLVALHRERPELVPAAGLPKLCAVHFERDRLEGLAIGAKQEEVLASNQLDNAQRTLADLVARANAGMGLTTRGLTMGGVTKEQLDDAGDWVNKCKSAHKKADEAWRKAEAAFVVGRKMHNALLGTPESA
jgi:hypothetical protein